MRLKFNTLSRLFDGPNYIYLALLLVIFGFIGSAAADPYDFCQDYRAARFLLDSQPVYQPIDCHNLAYNAHPPFSVLFFVPFSLFSLPAASVIWALFSLACYAAAAILLLRTLGWWSVRSAVPLLFLINLWPAAWGANINHNLVQLLLLLLVAAWLLQRKGYDYWAGGLIGLAALLKLWPIILIVGFLLCRQWKVFKAGLATFLAGTVLSLGVLGILDYITYFTEVRSYEYQYWIGHRLNISLDAALARLVPQLNLHKYSLVSVALVVLAWLFVWRQNRRHDRRVMELCFGLLISISFIALPVSWGINLVLAALPCTVIVLNLKHIKRLPKWWYAFFGLGLAALVDPLQYPALLSGKVSASYAAFSTLQTMGLVAFCIAQIALIYWLRIGANSRSSTKKAAGV